MLETNDVRLTKVRRRLIPTCWVFAETFSWDERTAGGRRELRHGVLVIATCPQHPKCKGATTQRLIFHDLGGFADWLLARLTKVHKVNVLVRDSNIFSLRANPLGLLAERGWKPRLFLITDRAVWGEFRQDGRAFGIHDFASWLPNNIKAVTDAMRDVPVDPTAWPPASPKPANDAYRWVEGLARAWGQLLEWMRANDMGDLKPTSPAMANQVWRHKFYRWPVSPHRNPQCWEIERAGMMAGRTEAWRIGQVPGGEFHLWDIALCYPRIARDCRVPTRLDRFSYPRKLTTVTQPRTGLALLCEADVRTDVPVLPWRDSEGICWPVGNWRGWFWSHELAAAAEAGAQVRPIRALEYHDGPAMAEWGAWVVAVCEGRVAGTPPLAAALVKQWGRNLVGRFGMMYTKYEQGLLEDPLWVAPEIAFAVEDGRMVRKLLYMGKEWNEVTAEAPKYYMPSMLSFFFSMTRVWLWEAMCRVGLDHVLHCSTDSLWVDKVGHQRMLQWGAERWRHKLTRRRLEIRSSTSYVTEGERVSPGIPRAAVEVRPGVFEGEVRRSYLQQITSHKVTSVETANRTWTVGGTEQRRIVHVDGSTSPICVRDGVRQTG